MNKAHILQEIKRTAEENGGKPLGRDRFRSETGIKESDWSGVHWLRWSDALREAGFSPNLFTVGLPEEQLFEKIIQIIRELGHYPIKAEFRMKRRSDPSFPDDRALFGRFGSKQQLVEKLIRYSLARGYQDAFEICKSVSSQATKAVKVSTTVEVLGSVYLAKSGRYYKIGATKSLGRREYELGIQLPERLKLIHEIKTDDPVGIEGYWHSRFKDRRKNGEWFDLMPGDLSAFTRRKFM